MKQRNQSGYSLIEVLIALAITSIVLLSVVTLFYMGRRNVYSGKQMTYSVSVGTRILEDLSSMSAPDVTAAFAITDTTARSAVTVQGITYANSAMRDTAGCTGSGTPVVYTCTNDPNGYLASWKGLITESKLANAKAGLIFTPRAATDNNAPWSTATFLKVRAYVQWDEAQNRRRIAFFDTTKVNRQ
jgi:prepilin-type N-terminal cleavage/methylation domain-containing protein